MRFLLILLLWFLLFCCPLLLLLSLPTSQELVERAARLAKMRQKERDMVADRSKRNIKALLTEYRDGNPLYAKPGPTRAPPQRDRWYEQKGLPVPGAESSDGLSPSRRRQRAKRSASVPVKLKPLPSVDVRTAKPACHVLFLGLYCLHAGFVRVVDGCLYLVCYRPNHLWLLALASFGRNLI
eukprot:SAG31_NODE_1330_length_8749_cov_23.618844_6_plen_182_part_00